jgi:peptidoglycan/LPS O-acetylase OafA/YrhL
VLLASPTTFMQEPTTQPDLQLTRKPWTLDSENRSDALDGLRGVLVTSTLIFHAHPTFEWIPGAFHAIDPFFVLSGFLITSRIIDLRSRGRSWWRFFARRLARFVPALLLMLIAYTIACLVVFTGPTLQTRLMELVPVVFYVSNWARAFSYLAPYYLGHTWSLAIEEQYYIVWPILMHWLLRWRSGSAAVAALGLALMCAGWRYFLATQDLPFDRLYNGTDTRFDGLMFGSALALYLATARDRTVGVSIAPWVALVGAAGLIWMFATKNYRLPSTYTTGILMANAFSVVLVWALVVAPRSFLARFLSFTPFALVGTVSYGLYLWHWPIYRFMHHFHMSPELIFAIGASASLLLAAFSYNFVEKPILKRVPR